MTARKRPGASRGLRRAAPLDRRAAAPRAPGRHDASLPICRRPAPRIAHISPRAKKRAVAQARRAAFYQGRLDHVDADRLDDPDEWRKIPVLDKEMLRRLDDRRFYKSFLRSFRRRHRRILALGRRDRHAAVLSAELQRYRSRDGRLCPYLRLHRLPARRPGACVVPARHSSGRPDARPGSDPRVALPSTGRDPVRLRLRRCSSN